MIERGRISNIQAAMLSIMTLTIMGHLILLTLVIVRSRQDGWISATIGTALGLSSVFAVTKLAQRHPGVSLVELAASRFRLAGKLLAMLFLLYFGLMTILAVRLFAETYSMIMPETPFVAFVAIILLLCAYLVHQGLETFGRMNQIMLPVLVAVAMLVVLLTVGQKDYGNLLPILGRGPGPVAAGALSIMGWFGEFVLMGMILPYARHPAKLMRYTFAASGLTLLFFIGPVTGPIAMFGADEAARLTFPTFAEVRYIEASDVLNRFDAIAILFWTVGLMFRITVFFYGLCLGTGQLLKLRDYRPLILPYGWLLGGCAFWFADNFEEMSDFLFRVYVPLNLVFGYAVPILLALASHMMKKGGIPLVANESSQRE
ncbi:GerAB/ArcD/ProY family transporter [Paenibacillus methanolicus]|uniref:Spore germination protein KB n=1 Tax=Paenibacillus methanolicus TaxID=582686 RepID=A0A5S5CJR6_9BACL|nr:endospore germination permease [Paenibacillus methanolicus]TYP79253.1 spore germination protein KB [Paenibacillus methanolicus]